MKIEIASPALEDIKNIESYISDTLSSPMAAERIMKKIRQSILLIADTPMIGKSLKSKIQQETQYRFLTSGKYLIFYVPEKEKVVIHRVIYGKRNYLRIIFNSVLNQEDPKE